jgi:hypothetical protein
MQKGLGARIAFLTIETAHIQRKVEDGSPRRSIGKAPQERARAKVRKDQCNNQKTIL